VTELNWEGTGPERSLRLRSVTLVLNVEKPNPGLEWLELSEAGIDARLLALEGLSGAGRFDPLACGAQSLVGWDIVRGRFEAIYEPLGWQGLTIRGAWTPTATHDGVDLEIQASAGSSAVLRQVEVHVSSRCIRGHNDAITAQGIWIEPRDAQSAAHTYDGREPAPLLRQICTRRAAESGAIAFRPLVVPVAGASSRLHYVEMVHPDDVARRIIRVPGDEEAVSQFSFSHRYGLLGHDIEKGVVLRARLRGLWFESESPEQEAMALYREFQREPPPLGP